MKKFLFVMFVVMLSMALVIPAFAKSNTTSVSQGQNGGVSQTQVGNGVNAQGYSTNAFQGYKVTTCSPKATAKASQNTNTGAGQLNFGKGQSQSGSYYNNQGVTIK